MPIDADLLGLLACPSDDHAPLHEERRDGADVLVCTYCASSFPVQDGIPVLLIDDATPGPNGIGVAATIDAGGAAGTAGTSGAVSDEDGATP